MSIIKYIIRSKKKYWNQGSNPFNEIQGWNPFHKVKASKPFMKSISNPFYKTKVRVLLIKSSLFFSFNLAKLWNLILKLRFKPNSWSQSSNPVLEAKVLEAQSSNNVRATSVPEYFLEGLWARSAREKSKKTWGKTGRELRWRSQTFSSWWETQTRWRFVFGQLLLLSFFVSGFGG